MAGKPRGYQPTEEPGPARVNMTVDELHSMLARFKQLFEDSKLAKYIVWAGVFSLLTFLIEALHTAWLALRFIFKF